MILLLCGVGFGIFITIGAIALMRRTARLDRLASENLRIALREHGRDLWKSGASFDAY